MECTAGPFKEVFNKLTITDGPIQYRISQTKQDSVTVLLLGWVFFTDSYHVIRPCHYLRPKHDVDLVNHCKVLKCHVTMMDWVIRHLL